MKYITLKNNKKLQQLTAMFNIPTPDLAENICYRLIKARILFDIEEECGTRLSYLIHESGFTLKETGNFLLSGLIVWGKSGECPQCGCKLDVDGSYKLEPETGEICKTYWEKTTCSNPCCDYEDIEDNESDPDEKYDR